ncbi:hypothetical protein P280DRAFT_473388 [Massarina eburnea CBS 473.64]|uniref:Uncharacterized protein n=1 Tax=Massarina eburnea CBS 473.64 TaxID=1395130 RepID=A0A6A6RP53_9PLEO|nr:hypothetical protein P280DRAFT_473388 [Massarina eburnea CBS 473.64]
MPLGRRTARTVPATTRTTRARPSLKTRLLGPKRTAARRAPATTTTTTTRTTQTTGGHHAGHTTGHTGGHTTGHTAAPAHHHKRHASMGDKVSGAMMKLRGSITHRPGLKAAGTRRMHGTDGRGSHHVY